MVEIVKHHFVGDDIYMKEFTLADNECVRQHKHEFDHITIITNGCVCLDKNGDRSIHYAPAYLYILKGLSHSFTAINGPAKGYCTHVTTEKDPAKIDHTLISPQWHDDLIGLSA